jgi:hypothetical protein
MKRFFPIGVLILAAGCNGRSVLPPGAGASPDPLPPPISVPATESPESSDKPVAGALAFTAAANAKTMRRGQTLSIAMQLRNTGKTAQALDFPSGQDFDLQVRRVENGKVVDDPVWTWSMDKMFTMVFRQVTLRPSQTLNFSATWDGTASGTTLPRGEYEISAFTASNPRFEAPPIRLTLN